MSRLVQGRIVRAKVRDQHGRNPKIRPLVIVSSTPDVQSQDVFVAVAVTSQFSDPDASDEVPLPWHPHGLGRTGLRKASVAKCSWQCEIRKRDIEELKGVVPPECMEKIIALVSAS